MSLTPGIAVIGNLANAAEARANGAVPGALSTIIPVTIKVARGITVVNSPTTTSTPVTTTSDPSTLSVTSATTTTTNITTITADAVVEEMHEDESVITDHPVELNPTGNGTVSDNMYDLPAQLSLTYAWSLSSPQNTSYDGTFLQTLYQKLLALKKSHQLFSVTTGKRKYSNMVVQSLSITTNKETENSLIVRMVVREIQVVTTQTYSAQNQSTVAFPTKTSPVVLQGQRNVVTAPNANPAGLP